MPDRLRRLWFVPFLLPLLSAQTPLISVTPGSGYGSVQSYTAAYYDSRGYRQIGSASVLFSSSGSAAGGCWVAYDNQLNVLKLARDDGATWDVVDPAGVAQNSQCRIRGSDYGVTGQQFTLTFAFLVAFKPAFAGMKSIYLEAHPLGLASTGFEAKGTWNVLDAPDFNLLVKPPVLAVPRGATAAFDVLATGTLGANSTPISLYAINLPDGVTASFDPPAISLGGSSRAKLMIQAASGAAMSTSNLLVIGSSGMLGHSMAVQLQITTAPQIVPVSVSPASGNGPAITLSSMFSDSRGQENISGVNVLIGSTFSGANACWLYYDRETNTLSLARDDGAAWDSTGSGTLQNSQCSAAASSVSTTGSGQQLTVTIPITFKSAFAGSKTIYTQAFDHGIASGYQAKGSWTVAVQGFTLAVSPPEFVIGSAPTPTFTVTVTPLQGFTGTVALSAADLPAGMSAQFTPASIVGSGTSMLTLGGTVQPATFRVIATSGALSQGAVVKLSPAVGPTVAWVRQISGPLSDLVYSVFASANRAYLAGNHDIYVPVEDGYRDESYALAQSYDVDGNLVWSDKFTGPEITDVNYATSVAADSTGVYVAGTVLVRLDWIRTKQQPVLRRYALDGTLLWSRTVADEGLAWAVALDGSGVYVADYGTSTLFKFDLSGNRLWTAPVDNLMRFMGVNSSGLWVASMTGVNTAPNQWRMTYTLSKFSPEGVLLWTRQYGGPADFMPTGMAVVASGAYMVGNGAVGNGLQGHIHRYDNEGNLLWARDYAMNNAGFGPAASDGTSLYIAGWVSGVAPSQFGGGYDIAVGKYSSNGDLLWTRQFGTAADDSATSISVNASGIYVGGSTNGAFPGYTYSSVEGIGYADGFLAKLKLNP